MSPAGGILQRAATRFISDHWDYIQLPFPCRLLCPLTVKPDQAHGEGCADQRKSAWRLIEWSENHLAGQLTMWRQTGNAPMEG